MLSVPSAQIAYEEVKLKGYVSPRGAELGRARDCTMARERSCWGTTGNTGQGRDEGKLQRGRSVRALSYLSRTNVPPLRRPPSVASQSLRVKPQSSPRLRGPTGLGTQPLRSPFTPGALASLLRPTQAKDTLPQGPHPSAAFRSPFNSERPTLTSPGEKQPSAPPGPTLLPQTILLLVLCSHLTSCA